MAITTVIGHGTNTLFWKDRWLFGQQIEDLAPLIFSMVPRRIANKRTVAEALEGLRWTGDVHGVATMPVIVQFFHLCSIVLDMTLQ